jgi:hypothetical protein
MNGHRKMHQAESFPSSNRCADCSIEAHSATLGRALDPTSFCALSPASMLILRYLLPKIFSSSMWSRDHFLRGCAAGSSTRGEEEPGAYPFLRFAILSLPFGSGLAALLPGRGVRAPTLAARVPPPTPRVTLWRSSSVVLSLSFSARTRFCFF